MVGHPFVQSLCWVLHYWILFKKTIGDNTTVLVSGRVDALRQILICEQEAGNNRSWQHGFNRHIRALWWRQARDTDWVWHRDVNGSAHGTRTWTAKQGDSRWLQCGSLPRPPNWQAVVRRYGNRGQSACIHFQFTKPVGYTFKSKVGSSWIDHVVVNPNDKQVQHIKIVDDNTNMSDHRALSISLEVLMEPASQNRIESRQVTVAGNWKDEDFRIDSE